MADKTIGGLPAFDGNLSDDALLIIEQGGSALKMTGAQWKQYAISAAQNKASEVANKIAQKAKESENNAKAYAEGGTVQNTTYDESGNMTGITATEVTGAKGYQENASGYATRSAQAMTRAAAYAEGGTAPATLIGNVSYPAIDTIGAKGYMDAAQAASESAGSEKGAAEAARAAAEAAESGAIAAKNAAEAAVLNGPKIENDTWWVYDAAKQTYVDTGVDASGLAGQPGSDGKNAYQYAQDGGYTGSETEFAAKLAAEHLPVPATAAVGQYFKAKTVDGNGLVTEVEAVDAPTGGGHWETVLETTWDVPTITPTAFDPETGYFTCAADDLATLDAGAEMDCYIRFADDAKSTQIPLSGDVRIVWCIVGKIDDTTFCVKNFDLTGQTTIDCSKFFFDQAKCMIVENFNSRKFRLTLDGKFSAPISLYDFYGFFGVHEKTYLSRSVGYQKIASKYGSLVMEKEIISPYTAIGRVVGSAWFVSANSAYEDKFADITSAFFKKTATSTNEKGYFTDDGLMLKKLHSSSSPWVAKPFYYDMLKIRKGCYVKLERWVE